MENHNKLPVRALGHETWPSIRKVVSWSSRHVYTRHANIMIRFVPVGCAKVKLSIHVEGPASPGVQRDRHTRVQVYKTAPHMRGSRHDLRMARWTNPAGSQSARNVRLRQVAPNTDVEIRFSICEGVDVAGEPYFNWYCKQSRSVRLCKYCHSSVTAFIRMASFAAQKLWFIARSISQPIRVCVHASTPTSNRRQCENYNNSASCVGTNKYHTLNTNTEGAQCIWT